MKNYKIAVAGTGYVGLSLSVLLAQHINPQKSERELKNRLNRKKNFMRREWQERAQGKYVLRYKGENITIMKSKFGAGWGVLYGGQSVFRYNNRRIDDFHTARLIAFDLFDEQHHVHLVV